MELAYIQFEIAVSFVYFVPRWWLFCVWDAAKSSVVAECLWLGG